MKKLLRRKINRTANREVSAQQRACLIWNARCGELAFAWCAAGWQSSSGAGHGRREEDHAPDGFLLWVEVPEAGGRSPALLRSCERLSQSLFTFFKKRMKIRQQNPTSIVNQHHCRTCSQDRDINLLLKYFGDSF